MQHTFRIAILGMGGVGGYLGAKLAAQYHDSKNVEITFIARGKNLAAIRANGLKLSDNGVETTVFPFRSIAANETSRVFDLVICCVKSYDLDDSLRQISRSIGKSTLILPFLNGVDASERIENIMPAARVLTGCCYIVSRLEAPGQVSVTGALKQFCIGSGNVTRKKLAFIAETCLRAGIDLRVNENIDETVWTKYLFISPFATLTSALDVSLGAILANQQHSDTLMTLMLELKRLAEHKGVIFAPDVLEGLLHKYSLIPYEATSSLHTDFKNSRRTELDALTAYVVSEARKLRVSAPSYKQKLKEIKRKWSVKT